MPSNCNLVINKGKPLLRIAACRIYTGTTL
nr:MAG TPA: hypothetical protein [Caudoviricetes sp.]